MVVQAQRKSAEERRDDILEAALVEFAERGLHGASTDEIAKRAGISQPYVFRLFGSKKDLFKATISRCFRETLELFQRAAEGKRGEEALHAMGEAYQQLLVDRTRLRAQMQAYAASDDPEIREVVRNGFGDIVAYVERVAGLPDGGDRALLRRRDAHERHGLDGLVREARGVVGAPARGLQEGQLSEFFSGGS